MGKIKKKQEVIMADYKIDGKYLKDRHGSKLGEFDGRYFKDSHGSKVGEVDKNYIKDSHGHKVAELDGKYIKVEGRKETDMDHIQRMIDGSGGISLVGFWVLFVR